MDLLDLFRQMSLARAFEPVLGELRRQGLVSGDLHPGTGEEAASTGVAAHIRKRDGVAVDRRSTPVFLILGVDEAGALPDTGRIAAAARKLMTARLDPPPNVPFDKKTNQPNR